MEAQIVELLAEQHEVLKRVARSIETLERYASQGGRNPHGTTPFATKDVQEHSEKPFSHQEWNYEPAWAAVLRTASLKAKNQAELWISTMDSNLIFVSFRKSHFTHLGS